jgi:hypothetical protein
VNKKEQKRNKKGDRLLFLYGLSLFKDSLFPSRKSSLSPFTTGIFFFTFVFFSGIKYDNLSPEKGCFLFNKEEIFSSRLTAILEND